MRNFDPRDWYWLADDGRIFSSAIVEPVQPNDAALVGWSADGTLPTIWPRDEQGEQTDEALRQVLAPYGISIGGPVVPQSVSRAQAKVALHRAGLLDMVRTAVSADPEVQIWFDDALTWERNNTHIVALGDQLIPGGAETVDELFIAAAQIAA